ncbi:MAG: Ig-like domain repeat protein, partial [Jatrophihabitantaceae bacterium]
MKALKTAIAGAAALAVASAGLFLGAGAAHAAGTADPAITGDPNAANGTISFYNAAGTQITSGSLGDGIGPAFAAYAVASSPTTKTGTPKATLFVATPDHTKTNSLQWFNQQLTAASTWPLVGAPASVAAAEGAGVPAVAVADGDGNLAGAFAGAVNDPTTGFDHIMQVRMEDSGPGKAAGAPFWQADLFIDTTAGTWTQVYPTVATATSTTLTATPDPSTVGDTVTLSATETPATAGSVQFMDGATAIGSPVAVSGTGTATTTTSTLTQGSHALSAKFTPTNTAGFGSSTGTFTATVNPVAPPTTTTLAVSGNTTTGTDATLTATVSPSTAPGTVAFFDNGSTTAIPGTVSSPSAGTYALTLVGGFTAGNHSVVAKFSSANVANFRSSQSAAQVFFTSPVQTGACAQPGSVCTDTQNIQATIPVGTLVINTPYTAASPLDLGTMVLSADSTKYSANAPFTGIKVTDTRAGNLPWTVSALASNLTDG